MDSIGITGIEVFAFHGVLASEKETGQRFLVDVEVGLDLSAAGATDDLGETVDYGLLAQRIHDLVASERWDLIERVATRVAESGPARIPGSTPSWPRSTSPQAPIAVGFGDVSVTVRRDRG